MTLLTPSHLSGVNSHSSSETFLKFHILISFPLPFIFYHSKHPFVASIAILAICNYFLFVLSIIVYTSLQLESKR